MSVPRTVNSSNVLQWLRLARLAPETRNLILVSHKGGQDSNFWTIIITFQDQHWQRAEVRNWSWVFKSAIAMCNAGFLHTTSLNACHCLDFNYGLASVGYILHLFSGVSIHSDKKMDKVLLRELVWHNGQACYMHSQHAVCVLGFALAALFLSRLFLPLLFFFSLITPPFKKTQISKLLRVIRAVQCYINKTRPDP